MPHLVVRTNAQGSWVEGQAEFSTGVPGGVRAWWKWDGAQLTAGSEPWGFYPLYLLEQPGFIGIATSIVELLPFVVERRFDEAALSVFARLGTYLGQDTPWQQIRAFPAASRITWVPGAKPVVRDVFTPGEATSLDRAGIIRRYLELFEAAVQATVPRHPVVVPLSGGRDSRHILLELVRAGRPVDRSVTAVRGDDIRVAGKLSAALGVPHQVIRGRASIHDELRKNAATSFCSDEHGWIVPALDVLSSSPLSIYDGIAGGMLSAGAFLNERDLGDFNAGRFGELAKRMLRSRERKIARTGGILGRFALEPAIERVEAELRARAGRVNGLTEFYLWNRTRREIALYTFEMLGAQHEVHAPYLSRPLVEFLLSVPVRETIGQQLHTDTIAAGYPQHAHVPYERKRGLPKLWRTVRAVRPAFGAQVHAALEGLTGRAITKGEVGRIALHGALEGRITAYLGTPICLAQVLEWPVERMRLAYETSGLGPRPAAMVTEREPVLSE